ncbi:hypothetical protein JCM18916_3636 [Cutibacterium acnes JCM 18916]|nr:hypothetical protein JCM18916_3636 [Cutibacterium acnes JCM 18916]
MGYTCLSRIFTDVKCGSCRTVRRPAFFHGRKGPSEDVLTRLSVGGNTPAGSSVECSELNFMKNQPTST